MTHNLTGIAAQPSYISEKSYQEALNLRIAVLIPDRGDRLQFTQNCFRLIAQQTLQPIMIAHINELPNNGAVDITYRYRKGYELIGASGEQIELIAFIENDDYYAPNYLHTMAAHWIEEGKPQMIGNCYSWYYHIGLLQYTKLEHYTRSAAMNTLIVPNLNFKWCADSEPYTDMHLWSSKEIQSAIINTPNIISIGLKHGVGKCGGGSHVDRLNKYKHNDYNMEWLFENIEPQFYSFYTQLHAKLHGKY